MLDIDSSESPVYGQQEDSAYNGHFESVCYHSLFLFNDHAGCLAAKLRSGNVSSADDSEELVRPRSTARRPRDSESRSAPTPPPADLDVARAEWLTAGVAVKVRAKKGHRHPMCLQHVGCAVTPAIH